MPARAGRDPAAERRILEALREMPQRQPVRPQLRFERRAEHAGLDARGARGAVDLHDPVEMAQVEADRRLVPATVDDRLDPADDAAAAAERDHDAASRAAGPVDDRGDFGFVARIGDDVGGMVVFADQASDVIREGFAVAVGGAVVEFARQQAARAGGGASRGGGSVRRVPGGCLLELFDANRRLYRSRAAASSAAVNPSPSRPHPKCFSRPSTMPSAPRCRDRSIDAIRRPAKPDGPRQRRFGQRRKTLRVKTRRSPGLRSVMVPVPADRRSTACWADSGRPGTNAGIRGRDRP